MTSLQERIKALKLYPDTDTVTGKISHEDRVKRLATYLYDDLVCGRRLYPSDVYKLLQIAFLLRGENLESVKDDFFLRPEDSEETGKAL